jgi:hypothetical protein
MSSISSRFTGTLIFTDPNTGTEYHVKYRGSYKAGKRGSCADNSYPPEWDLDIDLPPELNEFEDIIRRDILEIEDSFV